MTFKKNHSAFTYNLLDDLRRAVQIDDTLVDAHLEAIPGLGTFTTRGLAGGNTKSLGGHADRSLDLERLSLGVAHKVGRH